MKITFLYYLFSISFFLPIVQFTCIDCNKTVLLNSAIFYSSSIDVIGTDLIFQGNISSVSFHDYSLFPFANNYSLSSINNISESKLQQIFSFYQSSLSSCSLSSSSPPLNISQCDSYLYISGELSSSFFTFTLNDSEICIIYLNVTFGVSGYYQINLILNRSYVICPLSIVFLSAPLFSPCSIYFYIEQEESNNYAVTLSGTIYGIILYYNRATYLSDSTSILMIRGSLHGTIISNNDTSILINGCNKKIQGCSCSSLFPFITDSPIINKPSTTEPSTNIPSTNIPSNNIPSTIESSTIESSTNIPSTNIPSTNIPSTNIPSTISPSINLPSTNLPSNLITTKPSTISPNTISPNTVSSNTIKPSTIKPSTIKPSTIKPSTVIPSTITPSTISPVCNTSCFGCNSSSIKKIYKEEDDLSVVIFDFSLVKCGDSISWICCPNCTFIKCQDINGKNTTNTTKCENFIRAYLYLPSINSTVNITFHDGLLEGNLTNCNRAICCGTRGNQQGKCYDKTQSSICIIPITISNNEINDSLFVSIASDICFFTIFLLKFIEQLIKNFTL